MKTLLQWLGAALSVVVLGAIGLMIFGFYLSMTVPHIQPEPQSKPEFEYATYRACPKWAQTEGWMNDHDCPGYPPYDRWWKEEHQRCMSYHSVDKNYEECGARN